MNTATELQGALNDYTSAILGGVLPLFVVGVVLLLGILAVYGMKR